jgi:hypothetical protein
MSIPNPLPPHEMPSEDDPEMDPADEREHPHPQQPSDRGDLTDPSTSVPPSEDDDDR